MMQYGGVRRSGSCRFGCDGMPVPDDPAWVLENDDQGCPVWKHPNDYFYLGGTSSSEVSYCGGVPTDSGAD